MYENNGSYFDGGLLELVGYYILGALVTVLTLGICYPWAFTMVYSWEARHTVVNGYRLWFDGTALQLFGSIDEELVPKDSLIREFIGGGTYEY